MALALVGHMQQSLPGGIEPGYVRPIALWQARAQTHIGGNIGCIRGTIEHKWHGPKVRRRYVDRWQILIRHRFDPANDLKRNIWGVLELAGNKPELRREIDGYMRGRDEDSNAMED
jgi:hypothetical protein